MWFKKLDLHENPLKSEDALLIGHEREVDEALYAIVAGNMIFIEGQEGGGKTAILKKIIDEYGGKGKIAYIDGKKVKDPNIENLLMRTSFWRGDKPPRGMILLVDNINGLSRKNNERLKYFFDQNYLKSVVFTGEKYSKIDFSESLKGRMSKVIILKTLNEDLAVGIINSRIKNQSFISDDLIGMILRRTNRTPKDFLEKTNMVFEHALIDSDTITKEHVEKILGKEEIRIEAPQVKKKSVIKKKIIKKRTKTAKKRTTKKERKIKKKYKINPLAEKNSEPAEGKIKIVYKDMGDKYY